jgi:S-adenosylmethionine:tRNA ribosyltransferase-isomerase
MLFLFVRNSMQIDDFDYQLPPRLIAQAPLADRQASRMMTVDRPTGKIDDRKFVEFSRLLRESDVLVLNNTKVFPARLFGETDTGAKIELFLIRAAGEQTWEALARPAKRLRVGKRLAFSNKLSAEVLEKAANGAVFVKFDAGDQFNEILEAVGKTPLPPYIKRGAEPSDQDRQRYQTVFARQRGSIAAPTAGLHFTNEILREIRERGVEIVEITLHVGYGTFEPVRGDNLAEHRVRPESCEIGAITADALNKAKSENRRIVAVGTTTTRALESNISKHGKFVAEREPADLTVIPGHRFKAIDALLTNFHLPKSSLLILVSTFAGHEFIMKAYEHAVAAEYRFYSYGDCMFIS